MRLLQKVGGVLPRTRRPSPEGPDSEKAQSAWSAFAQAGSTTQAALSPEALEAPEPAPSPKPAEPLAAHAPDPEPGLEPADVPSPSPELVPQETSAPEDPELPDLLALLPPELRDPTTLPPLLPGEPEPIPAETALLGLLSGAPRPIDLARAEIPAPSAFDLAPGPRTTELPSPVAEPWPAPTSEAPGTGPPDGEIPPLGFGAQDETPVDLPASPEPLQPSTPFGLAALLADGFALLDRSRSTPAASGLPEGPAPKPPESVPGPTAPGPATSSFPERTIPMSTDISATHDIAGFIGACLVDSESGLMLASEGGGPIDLEAAAALNTQVVRAKRQAIDALGLNDGIEDILITAGRQLHMIRPLEKAPSVFLYVALDRKAANLGLARMQVRKIESGLSL